MEKIIKTLNLENSQNFALLGCGINIKLLSSFRKEMNKGRCHVVTSQ